MAENGSPQSSFDLDNDYNLTLPSSLSSEVSEEVCLSWLSLEMEMLPYRFDPVPIYDRVYPFTVSPEIKALYVDRVGNTDW